MSTEAVSLVERQFDAYNAHDLEAFIACYAEDVQIFRLPVREPALAGRRALAEFYASQRFNLPELRADIVNRIALGNKVIDHEAVRGLSPGETVELVAVYEIAEGLISTVWFHYPK